MNMSYNRPKHVNFFAKEPTEISSDVSLMFIGEFVEPIFLFLCS